MKELVIKLISKSRVRNQDAQMGMSHTKPGDTCDLHTITYVNENLPSSIRLYGQTDRRQERMFEPKMNTSINLVCTENPSKELNYLLNQEFNLLRER
jgi:hypothetical protein